MCTPLFVEALRVTYKLGADGEASIHEFSEGSKQYVPACGKYVLERGRRKAVLIDLGLVT